MNYSIILYILKVMPSQSILTTLKMKFGSNQNKLTKNKTNENGLLIPPVNEEITNMNIISK